MVYLYPILTPIGRNRPKFSSNPFYYHRGAGKKRIDSVDSDSDALTHSSAVPAGGHCAIGEKLDGKVGDTVVKHHYFHRVTSHSVFKTAPNTPYKPLPLNK